MSDLPDDTLELYVRSPDGTWTRCAVDDLLLLDDYTIETTLPGGFSTCSAQVMPPEDIKKPEELDRPMHKFSEIVFRNPSIGVAWEGRLESTPQTTDDSRLEVSGIGHQSVLEDNANVVFLGVNSSLEAWGDPPPERTDEREGEERSVNSKYTVETTEEGLTIKMASKEKVSSKDSGEIWFTARKGQAIGEVQWIGSKKQSSKMQTDVRVYEHPKGQGGNHGETDSHNATAEFDFETQRFSPVDVPEGRYVFFTDAPESGTLEKTNRFLTFHAISVFGDHDIPRTEMEDSCDGLLFSDVLPYLLQEFAPRLKPGRILESAYPIPNIVWDEAVTMAEVMEFGISYEPDHDWAVYEDRQLHFAMRRDMGRTWRLRREEGVRWVRAGDTAEADYNGAIVSFTNTAGDVQRVGPPDSGADEEDTELEDDRGSNPVNAAIGMGDRYLPIDAGEADLKTAVKIGKAALEEARKGKWTGEVQVPRFAETVEGNILPSWMIRAGDKVLDGDDPGSKPRVLVGTSYTRSAGFLPLTGTIERPANRLDAKLARAENKRVEIKERRIRRERRRAERKKKQDKKKGGKKK